MGVTQKGDAFELQVPTQVVITASGTYKSATRAFVDTELVFDGPNPRSLIVSRTDLSSSVPTSFTNGACLRLGKGKYKFITRVRREADGTFADPNIDVASVTLYDDLHHAGVVGSASAFGSGNGFVLVSAATERPIMANARVQAQPAANERIYLALRVTDTGSGESLVSPRCIQHGSNSYPLETLAMPIFIKPERIYRFHYDLIYSGTAGIGASVSISG